MKVSFPLSLKVSLWLLANLLLLATAAGAFYVSQFGVGWQSLARGALGERLQSIGDSIASDLNVEPEGVRPSILRARAQKYGADFFLFTNTGAQVAGGAVELPAAATSPVVGSTLLLVDSAKNTLTGTVWLPSPAVELSSTFTGIAPPAPWV